MLQRDGLNIIFSHRTFQEFFAALCLFRMDRSKVTELLPRYAERRTDSIVSMLFDMNREIVEDCYLIPKYQKYSTSMKKINSKSSLIDFCKAFDYTATAELDVLVHPSSKNRDHLWIHLGNGDGYSVFIVTLQMLFANEFIQLKNSLPKIQVKDLQAQKTHFNKIKTLAVSAENYSQKSRNTKLYEGGKWLVEKELAELVTIWFQDFGYRDFHILRNEISLKICDKLLVDRVKRGSSLDQILGL